MARPFTLTEIYHEQATPQDGEIANIVVRARPLKIDLDNVTAVQVMPRDSVETHFGKAAAQVSVRNPNSEVTTHYVADKWSAHPQGRIPAPDRPAVPQALTQG